MDNNIFWMNLFKKPNKLQNTHPRIPIPNINNDVLCLSFDFRARFLTQQKKTMGASESTLSTFQVNLFSYTIQKKSNFVVVSFLFLHFSLSQFVMKNPDDKITTISERSEASDPILEKLKSLKITQPILTSPPSEGTLTDILVRKPSSLSSSATVNPKVLLELFSMYRDWQEEKVQKISKRQEDIENKVEVADALAIKIFQRFNYSVATMKTTSQHLSEVPSLQIEIGELKGRLTEVISNCDALCKRIAAEGPESLRSSIKPFAIATVEHEIGLRSSRLAKE
ncbi:unnamed protein product [Lupinus luteus]|uniref:Uncharacterized protein n=1 Tax=Lupinus luteus TaxID=3873 RepID=A0AAV1WVH2_LUPLU